MVSGQWMLNILRRQLFINTCTFLMMVVVVLHVSAPYIRMVSGQRTLSILRRQLFINTCTFLMMAVVVLQVLAP
ncbi:unnamed protein product, partial [Schistosoma curassoni]|uniref:CYTB_NTER domain-containing protein n=1 Tax=Schistosoma curassoni TaxID=6186 RepID=A0A183KNE7_9TREM